MDAGHRAAVLSVRAILSAPEDINVIPIGGFFYGFPDPGIPTVAVEGPPY